MAVPGCGIVVPVCNEAAILPFTVPRLLSCAQEVGARPVWVCNGCTDDSADLIARLLAGWHGRRSAEAGWIPDRVP